MRKGIDLVDVSTLDKFAAEIIAKYLRDILIIKEPGHCAKVNDISTGIMYEACNLLRAVGAGIIETYVLSNKPKELINEFEITSTKLTERRNVGDKVLVIFIPPNMKTSAEDSFGKATFEEVVIYDVYSELKKTWEEDIINCLYGTSWATQFKDLISCINNNNRRLSSIDWCLFYRCIINNGIEPEVVGASIAYLKLIPDFTIIDASNIKSRIEENLKTVEILNVHNKTFHERVQQVEIASMNIREKLYELLRSFSSRIDYENWVLEILKNEEYWDTLAFNNWEIVESETLVDFNISSLDGESLTKVEGSEYPVLTIQSGRSLIINFECSPPPVKCEDWDKVEVHLIDATIDPKEDKYPIVETVTIFKKPKKNSKTHSKKLTPKNLEKIRDAEGNLFKIGMRPISKDGIVLHEPVISDETFIVKIDYDQETNVKKEVLSSVSDAFFIEKIKKVELEDNYFFNEKDFSFKRSDANILSQNIEFTVNSKTSYTTTVNTLLVEMQNFIIANPSNIGVYSVDLNRLTSLLSSNDFKSNLMNKMGNNYNLNDLKEDKADLVASFLEKRTSFLNQLGKIKERTGYPFVISFEDQYLVEKAENYIKSYHKLIEGLSYKCNSEDSILNLLNLDCFKFVEGENCKFVLMAPTHPLRVAWALNFENVAVKRIGDLAKIEDRDQYKNEVERFIRNNNGVNYPNIIRLPFHGWMLNGDVLGDKWLIFIPVEHYGDTNYLDTIYSKLLFNRQIKRATRLDVRQAENKISRYLLKHPYITTLTINIFEPGEGEDVVDLLEALYDRFDNEPIFSNFKEIHFKIKLFASEFNKNTGIAIDDFMDTSEDKRLNGFQLYLTSEAENPLFPKFTYSKHLLREFQENPDEFSSNLSIVQQFLSANINTIDYDEYKNFRSSYIEGVKYDYVCVTNNQWDKDTKSFWKKVISTSNDFDAIKGEDEKFLLDLLDHYFNKQIVNNRSKEVPCVFVEMESECKKLLYSIHQASEWVVISDSLLGIEFLDRPSSGRDRINLIDFAPLKSVESSLQLYVSTDRLTEIEALVRPVCKAIGIPLRNDAERALIDSLNSISGKLALKLTQNETSIKGALGMALARLYIEEMYKSDQGNLSENKMIIVPVDAHDDWFTDEWQSTLSLRRTDIIGVIGNPKTKELVFHLIEVKWRNSIDASQNENIDDLVDTIKEQLENTEKVIKRRYVIDESELSLKYSKVHELMRLLDYYLNRSYRYKNMGQWSFEKTKQLISNLDTGYSIKFVKHGFIFSMSSISVTHRKEDEINLHIIGKDKIISYFDTAKEVFNTERFKDKSSNEEIIYRTELFSTPNIAIDYSIDNKSSVHEVREKEFDEIYTENDIEINSRSKVDIEHNNNQETEIKVKTPETEILDIQNTVSISFDVIIGETKQTPQYGLIGFTSSREKVAMDLTGCYTISLFGVQGSGKSYTLGSIIEMAVKPVKNLNALPAPLGAVIFHYSKTETYEPEFLTLNKPNDEEWAIKKLQEDYGVEPESVDDVVLITPSMNVEKRRSEYPGVEVIPLQFNTNELRVEDWQFLMGTSDNDAMYLKQLKSIIKSYRRDLTLNNIRQGIEEEDFDDRSRRLLRQRIKFVEEYVNDSITLGNVLKPGRVVIVDLRDEFVEESEALGLFMVLLRIFSNVKYNNNNFNKLIVFDEAHKYMDNNTLMGDVVEVIREMRHKGVSMLIASQNPPSVPNEIIELSNMLIMHKFNTPTWLKHVQKTITATANLQPTNLNKLKSGEAYVWASKSNYSVFEREAQKIILRPRITKHGGNTKKAIE